MKEVTLKVQGMSCAHCEKRVQDALLSTEGVMRCTASASQGEVVCEFEETKATEELLKQQIEETGYEVLE